MVVYVLAKDGKPLMPTKRLGLVRHMLKDGRATVTGRNPFTIRLTYASAGYTQPIEIGVDSGYQHIGVSVKTEREELFAAECTLLKDEKQRHDTQEMYRRTRRSRKRYRAPRFDNRKKQDGWIAPSLRHKAEAHVCLVENICKVAPVARVVVEVGLFDPALLKAMNTGEPIPKGVDYQRGPLYFAESLRQAVFQRDGYTCVVCEKSALHSKEPVHLHTHHALYWQGRHGNTLGELVTVCEDCHTSENHAKGGKLWGMKVKHARLEGATFMNVIRWMIVDTLRKKLEPLGVEVRYCYGAETSMKRKELNLEKSHATDAYCIGDFQPPVRSEVKYFQKRRRNNRCLEKFCDAKVIDIRDGKVKNGASLGCNRTNRRESRNSEKSLRRFRGATVRKGKRSIRKKHHPIQAGDIVWAKGRKWRSHGTHGGGKSIMLAKESDSPTGKQISVAVSKVRMLTAAGGWVKFPLRRALDSSPRLKAGASSGGFR